MSALASNLALACAAAAACAMYIAGVRRYVLATRSWPGPRMVAFIGGIVVLVAAFSSPLERLSELSLSFHMLQHLLILFVAAPLILLGGPQLLALATLPRRWSRTIGWFLHGQPFIALSMPVVSWLLFAVVLWGSHFSQLYEAALEHPGLHFIEHGLYLAAALLFWQAVIHIGPTAWPLYYPLRMLYVFMAFPQGAFLGLAIFSAHRVMYPHYEHAHFWLSPIDDQHAAGAIMWMGGGLLLFIAFLLLIAAWARADRKLAQQIDRDERRSSLA